MAQFCGQIEVNNTLNLSVTRYDCLPPLFCPLWGGRTHNGKCHLKFPFWLFEPFPKLWYLNEKTGTLLFFSRWGHRQSHRFLTFATAPVFTAGLIFLEVPFWRKSFGLLPSLQWLSWQFFFAAGIILKKQRLNKIWTLDKSELGSKQSLNDIILLNLSKS